MSDGSAPFWGALLSVLVFIVAFGRDLSSRFFKGYDEIKLRLEEIEAEAASNAKEIAQLTRDLEDERTKTRRERDDKEAAQQKATRLAEERDTVKLENLKLDTTIKDLSKAQETMRLEINEIKRDREERQRVYDLRLTEETERREQAERDRVEALRDRDEMRERFQTEIDELKRQIAELKVLTNGASDAHAPLQPTTHPDEVHVEGTLTLTPTEMPASTDDKPEEPSEGNSAA